MKFTATPKNPLTEKLEVENAVHHGKRYEIRTERKGIKVRAFVASKPYAKIKDLNYFVWDLIRDCKA